MRKLTIGKLVPKNNSVVPLSGAGVAGSWVFMIELLSESALNMAGFARFDIRLSDYPNG